jgi:hypothetical protein
MRGGGLIDAKDSAGTPRRDANGPVPGAQGNEQTQHEGSFHYVH